MNMIFQTYLPLFLGKTCGSAFKKFKTCPALPLGFHGPSSTSALFSPLQLTSPSMGTSVSHLAVCLEVQDCASEQRLNERSMCQLLSKSRKRKNNASFSSTTASPRNEARNNKKRRLVSTNRVFKSSHTLSEPTTVQYPNPNLLPPSALVQAWAGVQAGDENMI